MLFELLQTTCYLLTSAYIVFFFYNKSNNDKIMRNTNSLFLNLIKPVAEEFLDKMNSKESKKSKISENKQKMVENTINYII